MLLSARQHHEMTTQTFQIRFHTQTKHKTEASTETATQGAATETDTETYKETDAWA